MDKTKRYVKAEMQPDYVAMYARQLIPIVTESNHPGFVPGTCLDWGFVQVAIGDGYTVTIIPSNINRSNCEHPNGFDRTCILMWSDKEYRRFSCLICGLDRYKIEKKKLPEHLPADAKWDRKDGRCWSTTDTGSVKNE